MPNKNEERTADLHAIALRIVEDVERIQLSCQWQEIGPHLLAIQRAGREIAMLTGHDGTGQTPAKPIAIGYHQEILSRVEGLAAAISRLDDHALLQPETITLCEMLSGLVTVTLGKYSRAAAAVQLEFDRLLAQAEQRGYSAARPLDIDGQPVDEREAA